jgi:hypothetical protein
MKPAKIFQCLLCTFFLAGSCSGQTTETRDSSIKEPQTEKIRRLEHPEMSPPEKEGQRYVPGEILVKFKDGTGGEAIEIIQRDLSLETIRVSPGLPLHRMRILDGSSVEEVMGRLEGFDEVEYSEPNYIMRLQ